MTSALSKILMDENDLAERLGKSKVTLRRRRLLGDQQLMALPYLQLREGGVEKKKRSHNLYFREIVESWEKGIDLSGLTQPLEINVSGVPNLLGVQAVAELLHLSAGTVATWMTPAYREKYGILLPAPLQQHISGKNEWLLVPFVDWLLKKQVCIDLHKVRVVNTPICVEQGHGRGLAAILNLPPQSIERQSRGRGR